MKITKMIYVTALLCAVLGLNPVSSADGDTTSKPAIVNSDVAAPGADADGDFTIGPNYTNAPELTVREGVLKGTLHEFTMDSADSKIYPGIAKNRPELSPTSAKSAFMFRNSMFPAHPRHSLWFRMAWATQTGWPPFSTT